MALYPNDPQAVDPVFSYSLTVNFPESEQIVNLQANKPFKDYILLNHWRYYRFTFTSDEIRMVSFSITPI